MAKFGVFSRKATLQRPDNRTREARMLKRVRAELYDALGGEEKVPPTQRILVEQCARLRLRLAMLDAKLLDGTLTDHDNRAYLSWNSALGRSLAQLGLAKAPPPEPTTKPDPTAAFRAWMAGEDKAA
jgi:hypothetical protein